VILVDTSIWIEHLARGSDRLAALLDAGQVAVHDLVEGELACGNLRNRSGILGLLRSLPRVAEVQHEQALGFLHRERLQGEGLSWIDVHLLVAARDARTGLWTADGGLSRTAARLGLDAG
jgi:predicted nucleic acid-binding protein